MKKGTQIQRQFKRSCQAAPITSILKSSEWGNDRCFIIGGGPSLLGFNFDILRGEKVIGINKAFIHYPVDINYGMDISFFKSVEYSNQYGNSWKDFNGIKLFLLKSSSEPLNENVYYVRAMPQKCISFDLNKGIYGGPHSGHGALMLALALGCKKIGLLGYDFYVTDRTHWHDGYEKQNVDTLKRSLVKFSSSIEEFGAAINKHALVANLSPNSALKCFPKMDIHTFLEI